VTKRLLAMKAAVPASASQSNEKEETMPQIIVTPSDPTEGNEQSVMLRERVSAEDFQSDHFQAQLVQRLEWAVADASELERAPSRAVEPEQPSRR
jgi:hypothetical protein